MGTSSRRARSLRLRSRSRRLAKLAAAALPAKNSVEQLNPDDYDAARPGMDAAGRPAPSPAAHVPARDGGGVRHPARRLSDERCCAPFSFRERGRVFVIVIRRWIRKTRRFNLDVFSDMLVAPDPGRRRSCRAPSRGRWRRERRLPYIYRRPLLVLCVTRQNAALLSRARVPRAIARGFQPLGQFDRILRRHSRQVEPLDLDRRGGLCPPDRAGCELLGQRVELGSVHYRAARRLRL